MRSLMHRIRPLLFVLTIFTAAGTADAATPNSRSKSTSSSSSSGFNSWVAAQTKWISAVADAEAKLIQARADWITAVAEANATNAKTLATLEEVRSLRLDNKLKTTGTFYDKRKLYDANRVANVGKRPTKEDLIRYSRQAVPQRPAPYEVSPGGKIHWPEVFQDEEFCEQRMNLECLFSQRTPGNSRPGSELSGEVCQAAAKMHETLRGKVRQLGPSEYVAARRFIDGLAYEARFPIRIEGVVAK